ncbi:DUF6376 family protein [Fictibacillus iocasae]|uniref:DUF6376 family protein n=1 Tax=Fictibacillus iocasae TaxID=2715437 RepID=A0ABW2NLX7_9BACL
MRKKVFFSIIMLLSILMTGCQALSDVTNGIEYVPAATKYVDSVQQFANDVPALAEKAISDQQAAQDLEKTLQDMKSEIQAFNDLTPPSMFEDIHNQVLEHNEAFEQGIDTYLENVKDGKVSVDVLEQTGLMDEVAVYSDLLDQIKKIAE